MVPPSADRSEPGPLPVATASSHGRDVAGRWRLPGSGHPASGPASRPLGRATGAPGRRTIMRRLLIGSALAVLLMLGSAGGAWAVSNPSGSGQPGVECGDEGATSEPAGFGTGGFEIAEARYAGSDGTASLNSGNTAAVSQYDVACF